MNLNLIIQASTVLILFLTLIAILWYTIETRWLREATVNSVEMTHRPLLTLSYKKDDPNLYINNAGNGNALEIHCRFVGGEEEDAELAAFDGYLDLLRGNQSLIFANHVFDKEHPQAEALFEARLRPLAGQKKASVVFTYKNMLHTSFKSEIVFDGKYLTLKSTKLLG